MYNVPTDSIYDYAILRVAYYQAHYLQPTIMRVGINVRMNRRVILTGRRPIS